MDFWDEMPPKRGDLRDINGGDDGPSYGEGALTGRGGAMDEDITAMAVYEREGVILERGYKKADFYKNKKRKNKRLAAGITAGVLTLALIVTGVVFRDYLFADDTLPVVTPPIDYHQPDPDEPFTPRSARRYMGDKDLAWEINMGGSGDDVLGDVFEINDTYYLFGHTDSTNYDFKGQDTGDLFVCTMNSSGRLLSAAAFGTGYKDTFVKVSFNDNGFFLLSETGTANPSLAIFNIGFDCVVKKGFTYPSAQSVIPKDIYVDRNMIYVCAEVQNQITRLKSPLFFAVDNQLSSLQWLQQPDATHLEFVAMFPSSSGFVALFNGNIAAQKYPVLCRFTKLASTEFVYLKQHTSGNNVYASDMIPSDNGSFLIFISDEGAEALGSVIKVSAALKQTAKVSTEIKQCAGGKLLYGTGDKFYAVCSYGGNARGRLIIDGVSGLSMSRIDSFNDTGTAAYHLINTGRILLLSTTDIPMSANIMLTTIDESFTKQYQNVYGGKGSDKSVIFYNSDDGLLVFGYTDSADGDVGGNYGRKDIWAFKIKPY